jgi:hypothetical protein
MQGMVIMYDEYVYIMHGLLTRIAVEHAWGLDYSYSNIMHEYHSIR